MHETGKSRRLSQGSVLAVALVHGKGKGKGHPETDHLGPEGK
jgi:hypothetical protein